MANLTYEQFLFINNGLEEEKYHSNDYLIPIDDMYNYETFKLYNDDINYTNNINSYNYYTDNELYHYIINKADEIINDTNLKKTWDTGGFIFNILMKLNQNLLPSRNKVMAIIISWVFNSKYILTEEDIHYTKIEKIEDLKNLNLYYSMRYKLESKFILSNDPINVRNRQLNILDFLYNQQIKLSDNIQKIHLKIFQYNPDIYCWEIDSILYPYINDSNIILRESIIKHIHQLFIKNNPAPLIQLNIKDYLILENTEYHQYSRYEIAESIMKNIKHYVKKFNLDIKSSYDKSKLLEIVKNKVVHCTYKEIMDILVNCKI